MASHIRGSRTLHRGRVAQLSPLRVRITPGGTSVPAYRVYGPTSDLQVGFEVIVVYDRRAARLEVWTPRYAAQVRASRIHHPRVPANRGVWGRRRWKHVVRLTCSCCDRILCDLHGDDRLRDVVDTRPHVTVDMAAGRPKTVDDLVAEGRVEPGTEFLDGEDWVTEDSRRDRMLVILSGGRPCRAQNVVRVDRLRAAYADAVRAGRGRIAVPVGLRGVTPAPSAPL